MSLRSPCASAAACWSASRSFCEAAESAVSELSSLVEAAAMHAAEALPVAVRAWREERPGLEAKLGSFEAAAQAYQVRARVQ